MCKSVKIIFLDIDGVLNNLYTKETFEGFVFVEDEKILLLKEIIESTNAEIVLTSTWRKGWFYKEHNNSYNGEEVWLFEALQEKLNEYGIELFDYTEEIGLRGEEISKWLEDNNDKKIESYVVIDDMDESELHQHTSYFIQTDIEEGLTKMYVEQAISLLNKECFYGK